MEVVLKHAAYVADNVDGLRCNCCHRAGVAFPEASADEAQVMKFAAAMIKFQQHRVVCKHEFDVRSALEFVHFLPRPVLESLVKARENPLGEMFASREAEAELAFRNAMYEQGQRHEEEKSQLKGQLDAHQQMVAQLQSQLAVIAPVTEEKKEEEPICSSPDEQKVNEADAQQS